MGYRRADVDRLLVEATVAYENVWRERAELTDHVHELERQALGPAEYAVLMVDFSWHCWRSSSGTS